MPALVTIHTYLDGRIIAVQESSGSVIYDSRCKATAAPLFPDGRASDLEALRGYFSAIGCPATLVKHPHPY